MNEKEVVEADGYVTNSFELVTLFKPKSSLPTPRSSHIVNYLTAVISECTCQGLIAANFHILLPASVAARHPSAKS